MELVQATTDDLDVTAGLFDAYRQFYGQSSNIEATKVFIAERLSTGDSMIILAVDDDNDALGFTQLYPSFSSVAMQRIWILNDLYVSKHARKSGVGSALLEAAKLYAEQTGACRLVLSTAIDNKVARSLYETKGYKRVVEFDNYSLDIVSI